MRAAHRVDHHQVHRAGTDQHIRDVQSLFAVIGLGDKQLVGFDAQTGGVADIQGVFGVHKGRRAAQLLAFGNDVQRQSGFADDSGP